MSYDVVLSEGAEGDFLAIVDFIARDNPPRARSFVAELRSRLLSKLSMFPASGKSVGTRRYTTFGNYVVVYKVDDDRKLVEVQIVTEGHRDWRRMLEELD